MPYQHLAAGQWHTISSPWRFSIPILAQIGGLVPVGRPEQTCAPGDKANEANLPADDYRGVEIVPAPPELVDGREYINNWYEDDGISLVGMADKHRASFTFVYAATPEEVTVKFEKVVGGDLFVPPWVQKGLSVILPVGDDRQVRSFDGVRSELEGRDDRGRACYRIKE